MSDEYISKEQFVTHFRKLLCEDCDRRKGIKNGKLKFCYEIGDAPCRACEIDDMLVRVEDFEPADVAPVPRWIYVEETLPEDNQLVLGAIRKKHPLLGTVIVPGILQYEEYTPTSGFFWLNDRRLLLSDVVCWMPLPNPPKEVKE